MTLVLSVPVPVDRPADQSCAEVARRTHDLLADLGHEVDVVAEPGADLAMLTPGGLVEVPPIGGTAGDPIDDLTLRLVAYRAKLVECAAPAALGTPGPARIGRLLLAMLAVRDDGRPWPTDGTAERDLAARLAPTDPRPLAIRLHPNDAQRLYPDQITAIDAQLRQYIYSSRRVALAPALSADGADAGRTSVRIRDVHYPGLAVNTDAALARDEVLRSWLLAVDLDLESLVTPTSVEAIVTGAHRSLPEATALATARWPQWCLLGLVRVGLRTIQSDPADLAALIEVAALMDRTPNPGDDSDAGVLAGHFPGIAAGMALAADPDGPA